MWIKNLRQVYSIVICLVASLVLMFSLGNILSKSLSFFVPELTNAYEFSSYSSNEAYLRSFENQQNFDTHAKERVDALKSLAESELTAKRLQEQSEARSKITAAASGTVLENVLRFFVALLFFVIHWSMFRRSERHSSNSNKVFASKQAIRPRFKT